MFYVIESLNSNHSKSSKDIVIQLYIYHADLLKTLPVIVAIFISNGGGSACFSISSFISSNYNTYTVVFTDIIINVLIVY